METGNEQTRSRQPYEKPRMRVIDLAADEVLVTGCKMSTGATAIGNDSGCLASPCYADGS